MRSQRSITAFLCQTILENPSQQTHITLNLLLQSVSVSFRDNFENSSALTSFTVTSNSFVGSILVEPDGDYWVEPKQFTWNCLEQYLDQFHPHRSPESIYGATQDIPTWATLLKAFTSVEVTWLDPEWDMIEIINTFGRNAASEISPEILHDLN
jgi:hypothetical protein